MTLRLIPLSERPELEALGEHTGSVWPEYNRHGDVVNQYWGALFTELPHFQLYLYDDEADEVVAAADSIPCFWDGTAEGLPHGVDGLIADGFRLAREGGRPNTLAALAVEIPAPAQGRQLSVLILEGMKQLAEERGFASLIAPLRPTWKERYPLVPIERYAAWRREDGLPFDPWMRVHHRMGAEIVRTEPESLRITGTVHEWEEWVGMLFPENGDYVFPHGLAPVTIDRDGDRGSYWEPNVWMRHPVG